MQNVDSDSMATWAWGPDLGGMEISETGSCTDFTSMKMLFLLSDFGGL